MTGELPHIEQEPTLLSPEEQHLYEVLVPDMETARIDPKTFIKYGYDEDQIDRDLAFVEKMEAKWNAEEDANPELKRSKMLGKLFEAMIRWEVIEHGWLGRDAQYIVASKVDDIGHGKDKEDIGGIDGIVRYERETGISHLALAIDVTQGPIAIGKKIRRIREAIDGGSLATMRYFESKSKHGSWYHGRLSNIAKVIVAVDNSSVRDLAKKMDRLLSAKQAAKKGKIISPEEFDVLERAVKGSPIRLKILLAIRQQLQAYAAYNKETKEGPHLKALTIIEEIIKRVLPKDKEGMIMEMILKDEAVAEIFKQTQIDQLTDSGKIRVAKLITPKPKEKWK